MDTHLKKSSTGNNLQCSQTRVKMMAPHPSVSHATEERFLVQTFHASTSSQHLLPNLPSNILHTLRHANPSSLHTFATCENVLWTLLIDLCTTTVPSSLQRNKVWTSSSRPSVSKAPPETTNVSFLIFRSSFNSFVVSMYFQHSTCSIQQSPKG